MENPKQEIRNPKQNQNSNKYDLEDRTLKFSKDIRDLIKVIPKTISNIEYSKQLIRSTGSVGANYIEANESISRKDFVHRIKICRKESRESKYWLELIEPFTNTNADLERQKLIQESTELMMIFSAIMRKVVVP